ncbi:solute carrier organic anion transporter family member 1C1-like [Sinocyclocheilus rhinocerous]|uniref:solute carrier organic anion transporter family member 1C1-like n=1 Tax=Sinocyclocheilus rhinocerous TaxID=307959 RepID=UPI0007B81131|nr:PREDICTED: solute carrier organic anion transporter family member 1C1-like [Sinocyclocheilus rhinocerous]
MRTLGGIPAPVYFGALIDSTYLKWGIKSCGGRGACRMYDSNMYRVIFLSLTTCLSGCSYFFIIAVIVLLRKQFRKEEVKALQQTASKQNETELQSPEMCHPDGSKTDTGPREKTESTNTEC